MPGASITKVSGPLSNMPGWTSSSCPTATTSSNNEPPATARQDDNGSEYKDVISVKGPDAGAAAIASLTAAVGTCAVLHPLDLIKTRMQGNGTNRDSVLYLLYLSVAAIAPGAMPLHRSTVNAVQQILGVEGVRGLYKGLGATMVASGMSWGVFRYLYEGFNRAQCGPMQI